MSASVKKDYVKKFERSLVQSAWRIVTTMTLHPVTRIYRVADLIYKIAFLYTTVVVPSEYTNDSKFLSLAKFDEILAGSLDEINILLEIRGFGIITSCIFNSFTLHWKIPQGFCSGAENSS